MFANLDVTANATAWTVIRIAQHPDVQEDLRRELHTYTQTKGSYEDYLCREETLLAACILEVSRLHPILRKFINYSFFPSSIRLLTSGDSIFEPGIFTSREDGWWLCNSQICRFNYCAKQRNGQLAKTIFNDQTDVIVDAYAINVDNPYWESPLKFDPSRHLGKKDNQVLCFRWAHGICLVPDRFNVQNAGPTVQHVAVWIWSPPVFGQECSRPHLARYCCRAPTALPARDGGE